VITSKTKTKVAYDRKKRKKKRVKECQQIMEILGNCKKYNIIE
jgi:hypothetical protein